MFTTKNNLLKLLTITSILLCVAGATTKSFGQNLIAHWTFDEGMGNTAASSVNSPAADGSFENIGNDPVWEIANIAPIPNNIAALHFDNDYDALVVDPSAVQPSASFTIAAWINLQRANNGCAAADQIFFVGQLIAAQSNIRFSILEGGNPSQNQFLVALKDTSLNSVSTVDPNPVTFYKWTHFAATFNAVSGVLKLFRDGVEVASNTLNGPFSGFQPTPPIARIGDDTSCAGSFPGIIDDLAIWDSELTQMQIEDIMNQGVSGPLDVTIDIKPGSQPNCFNINSHGVIPVAIFGSEDFDVSQIDPQTLLFGGLKVRIRGNKGPLCAIEYSNDDMYLDMVCHFEDDASMWDPGTDLATLTGNLFDNTPFEGSDSICVVPK